MGQKKAKARYVAGIDEAGRGPMIGPMVVCGVLVRDNRLDDLIDLGVRDSKILSAKKREEHAEAIKEIADKIVLETISASEIDNLRKRITLNEIEVRAFVSIVKKLHPQEVYMDAAEVNAERFGETIATRSGFSKTECRFVSEHKADAKYPIVSAASIIAKVERDRIISHLHEDYGDFGSGYPSDPKTVRSVKEWASQGDIPNIVRKSWESVERIMNDTKTKQSTIDSF
ncbi:MAG: ribonuclease HII [Candidatus Thorarchaeota archaeon]